MHDIVEADKRSRRESHESKQKYCDVLEQSGAGAGPALGDGVDDGGGHEGQGGGGHAAHQRDEQVQPRDGGGQGEGEQDQAQSEDILRPEMVAGVHFVLNEGIDDIHRDIELKRVREEYCKRHHHFD